MTTTPLTPIKVIEVRYDGGDELAWQATAAAHGNTVHGMASFEVWANTSEQVITDLLLVLDSYSIDVASDMCLLFDSIRSMPLPDSQPSLSEQASQRGWTFNVIDDSGAVF